MTDLGHGVRRLGSEWINWYVVEGDAGLTVVDAALPRYWPQLEDALRAMGRQLGDVRAVVLTHNHPDHIGLAARLHTEAGARVLVHEADAEVVRGDVKGKLPPGFVASARNRTFRGYLAHVVRHGGAGRAKAVSDLETFRDGDVLDVPGNPKAIHTPGHSPGHTMFLLEQHGVLFSGDGLVTLNIRTGARGPALLPINDDHEQAAASLERLAGVFGDTVLPGHGEPWTGGVAEAVRQARAGAQGRLGGG